MESRGRKSLVLWVLGGFVLVIVAFAASSYYTLKNVFGGFDGGPDCFSGSGDLAILDLKGVITDGEETLARLEALENRPEIKAVVIRIDSPGGSVAPSQEIYDAVLRLRAVKAVVCSLGDMAASGGYYIASACEKIVSDAGTLTGSIGVIMHFLNFKDLYAWAKVAPVTLKAGHFKDIGSESRVMTAEERELLQKLLDETHSQFKEDVYEGRNTDKQGNEKKTLVLSEDTLNRYADGRVLSGSEAQRLGFVDQLGGEYEAVDLAAQMGGIKGKPKILREDHGRPSWRDLLDSTSQSNTKNSELLSSILSRFLPTSVNAEFSLRPGVPYYLPAFIFSSGAGSKGHSR